MLYLRRLDDLGQVQSCQRKHNGRRNFRRPREPLEVHDQHWRNLNTRNEKIYKKRAKQKTDTSYFTFYTYVHVSNGTSMTSFKHVCGHISSMGTELSAMWASFKHTDILQAWSPWSLIGSSKLRCHQTPFKHVVRGHISSMSTASSVPTSFIQACHDD